MWADIDSDSKSINFVGATSALIPYKITPRKMILHKNFFENSPFFSPPLKHNWWTCILLLSFLRISKMTQNRLIFSTRRFSGMENTNPKEFLNFDLKHLIVAKFAKKHNKTSKSIQVHRLYFNRENQGLGHKVTSPRDVSCLKTLFWKKPRQKW